MIIYLCAAALVATAAALVALARCYNRAFPEAAAIGDSMERIDGDYCFRGGSETGFIIFAGAKADERAYAYVAKLLYGAGHTVVIPKVLFHMSNFGTRRGLGAMKKNPQVKEWVLVGHSLGGWPVSRIAARMTKHAAARPSVRPGGTTWPEGWQAKHAAARQSDGSGRTTWPEDRPAKHAAARQVRSRRLVGRMGKVAGVVLLASFASVDLSGLDIPVLRITVENDRILKMYATVVYALAHPLAFVAAPFSRKASVGDGRKLTTDRFMDSFAGNLPPGTVQILLKGANHTHFGAYTSYARDAEASVTWQGQQEETVGLILRTVLSNCT
ncbi:MAG: alpha/beta hydrolase [Lachnospiraceae bacterium]|nr:alpha/beta hydrolase [Lachnospiraceae bacterium]